MKADNYQKLNELIDDLKRFREDIYDYDFDRDTLWALDEAINRLKQI